MKTAIYARVRGASPRHRRPLCPPQASQHHQGLAQAHRHCDFIHRGPQHHFVLATLKFVRVPSGPVDAVIVLSILFLATEIVHVRQGRSGLTERFPWLVAFTFGLLHGFGFAGALAEVGLPETAIPLALFLCNVGVEIGQVFFVAAVLGLVWTSGRLAVPWPAWAWRVQTYAIGITAAFWTIQRVVGFWG